MLHPRGLTSGAHWPGSTAGIPEAPGAPQPEGPRQVCGGRGAAWWGVGSGDRAGGGASHTKGGQGRQGAGEEGPGGSGPVANLEKHGGEETCLCRTPGVAKARAPTATGRVSAADSGPQEPHGRVHPLHGQKQVGMRSQQRRGMHDPHLGREKPRKARAAQGGRSF